MPSLARDNESCRRKQRFIPILFHPDYTVGPGVTPDLLTSGLMPRALAGYTAGGELHPALRMSEIFPTIGE